MIVRRITEHLLRTAFAYAQPLAIAKERHPALLRFDNPTILFSTYRLRGGLSRDEYGVVTAALIEEVRTFGVACWQAPLLGAHAPMIHRLARSVPRWEREEAALQGQVAFLTALRTVPVNDYRKLLPRLKSRTERVFRRDRGHEVPQCESLEPVEQVVEKIDQKEPEWASPPVRRRELVRALDGMNDPERLVDMLMATLGEGESLEDYVARQTPANDNDGDRMHRALEAARRSRHRAAMRIRAALADE